MSKPSVGPVEIVEGGDHCTVIVTVDAPTDILPVMRAHARLGLEAFRRYPGFLGGALHVESSGTRLIQYLQWSSEAEYRACIDDPAWDALPSTRAFLEAVAGGSATVDARVFRVAAVSARNA